MKTSNKSEIKYKYFFQKPENQPQNSFQALTSRLSQSGVPTSHVGFSSSDFPCCHRRRRAKLVDTAHRPIASCRHCCCCTKLCFMYWRERTWSSHASITLLSSFQPAIVGNFIFVLFGSRLLGARWTWFVWTLRYFFIHDGAKKQMTEYWKKYL